MRKVKVYIALLLSLALVSLTACGAKTSAEETEENVVEVDFGNLTYGGTVSEPVQSVIENNSSSEAPAEEKEEAASSAAEKKVNPTKTVQGIPVSESWFDDCVFMGDSLTVGLSYYNDLTGDLGNAEFICSAGLGWGNSQWDLYDENEVHPMYNGQKVPLENADEFIRKLRAKTPDVQIYLQTITPMIASAEYDRLNNTLIKEYDDALEIFATQHNCKFINSWAALADENGQLPFELCQDPDDLGLHLTNEGCEIWADCILKSVY